MVAKTEKTHRVEINIAGDVKTAEQVCREFCMEVGLCVTVTPTMFVYTGGAEAGVKIQLINYPRFPSTPDTLMLTAQQLAARLQKQMCQHSYSIVADNETFWSSLRD